MDFMEILRGYTSEQFSEALFHLLVNFLISKGIIDSNELQEFSDENFTKILKSVIEADKEKALMSINKNKNEENV